MEALLVGAEFALGAYTILIKLVKTNLETQTLARMATYTVGAAVFGLLTGRLGTPSLTHLLTMGTLNTVHIASSYYAFKELPSATALSLFYTYPFFNILFSRLFLNEKINYGVLPWLALSFIGALLVIAPTAQTAVSPSGLLSIAISAITESLIYIAFRSKYEVSELAGILHLYGGGLIATVLASQAKLIGPFEFNWSVWKPLLLFNGLIGFVCYAIVFGLITKIPVEVFASFAFVGILSGFVFGEFAAEKRPTGRTVAGAILIALSTYTVRRYF
jgi:drug/metabolite transporter (DMT)-like permease